MRQRLGGNPTVPRPDRQGLLTGVLCRVGRRSGAAPARLPPRQETLQGAERPRAALTSHPHTRRQVDLREEASAMPTLAPMGEMGRRPHPTSSDHPSAVKSPPRVPPRPSQRVPSKEAQLAQAMIGAGLPCVEQLSPRTFLCRRIHTPQKGLHSLLYL